MKSFVSIFAAAVISGLGIYFIFEWFNAFGLLNNNVVTNIAAFVAFITALTTASATLATLFAKVISHADYRMVAKLEGRIQALERGNAPIVAGHRTPSAPPIAEK